MVLELLDFVQLGIDLWETLRGYPIIHRFV